MTKTETLKINYEDFFAVLKEWDEYIYLLLNEMPKKGFRVTFINEGQGGDIFASHLEISELSDLLWQSLKLGSEKVGDIHSSAFAERQVEYFKERFGNIDYLTNTISSSESYFGSHNSIDPMETFVKLGKAAQLQIVREGFLEIAVSNYEKSKVLAWKQEKEEKVLWAEQRKEVKHIKQLKQQAIELDKNKCVFCGSGARHKFVQLQKELTVENFVMSCSKCEKEFPRNRFKIKFGRFEKSEEKL